MHLDLRKQLIRQRFKERYPSSASQVWKLKKEKKKVIQISHETSRLYFHGIATPDSHVKWIEVPDVQKGVHLAVSRTDKGPLPLTVISQKLKRGLVVWEKYRKSKTESGI